VSATIVADASVLIAALVDVGSDGDWAEQLVESSALAAPELLMVETTNVLRRLERRGVVSTLEASTAYRDLTRLDIDLLPFAPFSARIWELRSAYTSYDAWYVAVAEAFECPLATLDARLVRAKGSDCRFITPG